jgi:hypothetical protein
MYPWHAWNPSRQCWDVAPKAASFAGGPHSDIHPAGARPEDCRDCCIHVAAKRGVELPGAVVADDISRLRKASVLDASREATDYEVRFLDPPFAGERGIWSFPLGRFLTHREVRSLCDAARREPIPCE